METHSEQELLPSRLLAIYRLAGTQDVRGIVEKQLTPGVLDEIRLQYQQILLLCGKMFRFAESIEHSLILQCTDIRWRAYHLHELVEDEYVLIRRICEEDGYPVGFTKDGLIVSFQAKTPEAVFDEVCSV